jgi:hypothetical protein
VYIRTLSIALDATLSPAGSAECSTPKINRKGIYGDFANCSVALWTDPAQETGGIAAAATLTAASTASSHGWRFRWVRTADVGLRRLRCETRRSICPRRAWRPAGPISSSGGPCGHRTRGPRLWGHPDGCVRDGELVNTRPSMTAGGESLLVLAHVGWCVAQPLSEVQLALVS